MDGVGARSGIQHAIDLNVDNDDAEHRSWEAAQLCTGFPLETTGSSNQMRRKALPKFKEISKRVLRITKTRSRH
jgi:hypothetical protein